MISKCPACRGTFDAPAYYDDEGSCSHSFHNPSRLPSSPAGEMGSKSLSEVLEELCPGVGRRNRPAWATPLPAEAALPEPMMTTEEEYADPLGADISEPKGSGGAAREVPLSIGMSNLDNRFVTLPNVNGQVIHMAQDFDAPMELIAKPAAPIAPAAQELVQELVAGLKLVRLALADKDLDGVPTWTRMRFWLNQRDIYNGDLQEHRVTLAVVEELLARAERKEGEAK